MTAEPAKEKVKQPTKADYKRMYEEEKAKNTEGEPEPEDGEGNLVHTVQWREKDGIYNTLKQRAGFHRLSVNDFCRKIIREKLGYYS